MKSACLNRVGLAACCSAMRASNLSWGFITCWERRRVVMFRRGKLYGIGPGSFIFCWYTLGSRFEEGRGCIFSFV